MVRALRARRPDDAGRRREHAVRRVAGVARGLRGREHIQLRAYRHVDQLSVVLAAKLVQKGEVDICLERVLRGVQHRDLVHSGDLGLRVHLRCTGAILHRLPR